MCVYLHVCASTHVCIYMIRLLLLIIKNVLRSNLTRRKSLKLLYHQVSFKLPTNTLSSIFLTFFISNVLLKMQSYYACSPAKRDLNPRGIIAYHYHIDGDTEIITFNYRCHLMTCHAGGREESERPNIQSSKEGCSSRFGEKLSKRRISFTCHSVCLFSYYLLDVYTNHPIHTCTGTMRIGTKIR